MKQLAKLRGPEWEGQRDATILLPVGSTEQHGAHLPLGTDAAIVEEICRAACARSSRLVLAPTVPYGASEHHRSLPGGAVSLRPRLLVDLLVALMEQLLLPARGRSLLVVNGHGGNWASVTCAIDELGSTHGELPVAACSWWHVVPDVIEAQIGVDDPGIGHAGRCETSVMLALDPESVATDRAPPGGTFRPEGASAGAVSPATFFRWLDFSLHFPEGVVGSPRTASPEIGHAIVDAAAERIVDVADRLHASAGAGV